ncbi:Hemicentin-2, partial [Aphelenchoides avenae]
IDGEKIVINNIRLSDAGEYICIASNEAGDARKKIGLNVLEKPRFLDMTNSNLNPSIIVGQPIILDCAVSGTPQPIVTWIK